MMMLMIAMITVLVVGTVLLEWYHNWFVATVFYLKPTIIQTPLSKIAIKELEVQQRTLIYGEDSEFQHL